MGWQQFGDASLHPSDTGLPKPLLRRLLVDSELTVGSRVLVVGCDDVGLPRLLDGLGIDATVIDPCPLRVASAIRDWPEIEVRELESNVPLPFPAHGFDGVIVTREAVERMGERVSASFGHWAAVLRPAGRLWLLHAEESAADLADGLRTLPGTVETDRFRTRSWFGATHTTSLTSLRIPGEPLAREAWSSVVEPAPADHTERTAA